MTEAKKWDKETCATCKFYGGSPCTDGDCRRHAPQLVEYLREIGQQTDLNGMSVPVTVKDFISKYPHTSAYQYCGDYERKPE